MCANNCHDLKNWILSLRIQGKFANINSAFFCFTIFSFAFLSTIKRKRAVNYANEKNVRLKSRYGTDFLIMNARKLARMITLWMITVMKNVNNFQVANVQPQSVAYKSVAYKKSVYSEKCRKMSLYIWKQYLVDFTF